MCIRDRREIAKMLNEVENKISLSGHTDGKPFPSGDKGYSCLLYTSDAADERSSVDLGGRRIIKKKKTK